MKTSRIVAGSGTVLLHALALAAVFLLGPAVHLVPLPRPVEVTLLRPPPPPPPPPVVEPPRRPEPLPVRAPARTPVAPAQPPRPREEPVRTVQSARPAPPVAPAPAPTPVPAPVVAARPIDEARPAGITAAAAPAAAPVAPQVTEGTAAGTARPSAPASAAPVRSGPRLDASWSGNAPPPYPSMARRLGEEGEVQLDVRVGPDGAVVDVRLKKSSGSQLLDQTAIDTVKKWRFRPATVDGQPVAEWYYNWKWVFKLES